MTDLPKTQIETQQIRDFTNLHCPHLLIAVIDTLKQIKKDDIVKIIADDINAPTSIPAWVRQSGNQMIDMTESEHNYIFFIQKKVSG